jgi:hypothetical protein
MGRRAGVVGVVLALAVAGLVGIASPSASAAGAHAPVGALDAVSARFMPASVINPSNETLTISGWAADQDVPGQPIDVHIFVNGRPVYPTKTGQARPDVQRGRPWAGPSTGWKVTLTPLQLGTPDGRLCAYALDPAGGSTLLGCRELSRPDPNDPMGSVDHAYVWPGLVRLQGWAGDPDGYRTTKLRIFYDGINEVTADAVADQPRPDVQRAFPRLGATTGFDVTLPIVPGFHRICIRAQNTGPSGAHNPWLDCVEGTVPGATAPGPHDPQGKLEAYSSSGATWNARGWAYDPDTAGPVQVRIRTIATSTQGAYPLLRTQRTRLVTLSTGVARSDVQSAHPQAGPNAGFLGPAITTASTLPPGVRFGCAWAVNVGPGQGRFLGCVWRG